MPTAAAVVLAGGSGTRLGAEGNKVYLPLAGWPDNRC
jgi:2-C-methyl-D-erythritol 4-phosphate cytidylyltransferase